MPEEAERFAALNCSTHLAMVGAVGGHLESTLR